MKWKRGKLQTWRKSGEKNKNEVKSTNKEKAAGRKTKTSLKTNKKNIQTAHLNTKSCKKKIKQKTNKKNNENKGICQNKVKETIQISKRSRGDSC